MNTGETFQNLILFNRLSGDGLISVIMKGYNQIEGLPVRERIVNYVAFGPCP